MLLQAGVETGTPTAVTVPLPPLLLTLPGATDGTATTKRVTPPRVLRQMDTVEQRPLACKPRLLMRSAGSAPGAPLTLTLATCVRLRAFYRAYTASRPLRAGGLRLVL